MKNLLRSLLIVFAVSFVNISCFEDLFGRDEEEVSSPSTSTNVERAGYDYSFTCSVGGKKTVPIPKGTEKCQKAQEYYARIYGCNEADSFNQANCKVCNDCGWTNYCSVCK